MNIIFPFLFGLVFIGIGGWIMNIVNKMSLKAKESLSWPNVEGEIAHSAILTQINRSGSGAATTSVADVVYRYKVNDVDYSSSTINVCSVSSGYGSAENIVIRYPDKSKVKVYYNPNNPSDSLLEPGNESGIKLSYFAGGIFVLAGIFFSIMALTGKVHMAPMHTYHAW